jgi:hypothetical protein
MSDTVAETISWPVMKKHLKMLEDQAQERLGSAEGVEVARLQGEVRAFKRLRNLPETLALLDAEDRRVAAEKER